MLYRPSIQVLGQTISHTPDTCLLNYDSELKRHYYTTVDKMPIFKGGTEELMKTIDKNLKWSAKDCDMEGTVFVACIIEANGQLTNKRNLKGFLDDKVCNEDKEALKVIDFLTTWAPGQCNGKYVAVQYIIPGKFKSVQD